VEVTARVRVKLDVVKGLHLDNPALETPGCFTTIASAPTLDQAVDMATRDMAGILKERIDLPLVELAMLMSATGQAQICQVVDPMKTARFVMPRWVLSRYRFKF
jgi:amidase